MIKTKFCFRLAKELGLSVDNEGNYYEAYACITIEHETAIKNKEVYDVFQESYRDMTVKQLKCDRNYIIPITEQEYLDNTEE